MSSKSDQKVVLVDEADGQIGLEDKLEAHRRGVLHRAISVFVFNSGGEVLLQKRAAGTYHCAGLWSNACCTHPYPGETSSDAAHRRLGEELGFDCPLEHVLSFVYRAELDGGLIENEFDHVFTGTFEGAVRPCADEVEAVRWDKVEHVAADMRKDPCRYTPWFRICLPKMIAAGCPR